jgi:hypothetical protein
VKIARSSTLGGVEQKTWPWRTRSDGNGDEMTQTAAKLLSTTIGSYADPGAVDAATTKLFQTAISRISVAHRNLHDREHCIDLRCLLRDAMHTPSSEFVRGCTYMYGSTCCIPP